MDMYVKLMSAYGKSAGIDFKFGGTVANTLDAHRVIGHWQEEKGEEVAKKIVDCMFVGSLSVPFFGGCFARVEQGEGAEMVAEWGRMREGLMRRMGGSAVLAILRRRTTSLVRSHAAESDDGRRHPGG